MVTQVEIIEAMKEIARRHDDGATWSLEPPWTIQKDGDEWTYVTKNASPRIEVQVVVNVKQGRIVNKGVVLTGYEPVK